MAADTLAYLTEVDSNLQQIAAISNQLVSALVDLLKCPTVAARQAAFRYVHTYLLIIMYLKFNGNSFLERLLLWVQMMKIYVNE